MAKVADKRKVWQRDRWLCRYCGCQVQSKNTERTDAATVDHVFPVSRGGGSTRDNIVTACRGCNAGKGDMTLAEYERAGKPRVEIDVRNDKYGASLKAGWMA